MAYSRYNLQLWPNLFRVYLGEKDVTPLPLVLETSDDELEIQGKSSEFYQPLANGHEEEETIFHSLETSESETTSSSHFRYSLTSPLDLECMELPYSDEVLEEFREHFRTPTPVEEVPIKVSQVRLRELMEETPLFPDKIILSLRETPTFFLLDRPSLTELDGTLEAEVIKKDNENFEYLTVGEGRCRYTKNAETQTKWTVWKCKDVWAPTADVKENIAEASTYDLYQSFGDKLSM